LYYDNPNEQMYRRKRKRNWLKRIALFLLIAILGFGGYVIAKVFVAIGKGYTDAKLSKYRTEKVNIKENPFTILFIGVDQLTTKEEKEAFRTDVLMLAAINPKTKSVKILSIPRDTYVEIANTNGKKDKIAHAAMIGRGLGIDPIENTRETVQNFLEIPVDYYAKINFAGFIELVDAVGGVDVNVKRSFSTESYVLEDGEYKLKTFTFHKGPMHLDGEAALPYVRMRKSDPLGDFGRIKRQQEVVEQIVNKIASFESLAKLDQITGAVGNNLTYSVPPSDFLGLLRLYEQIPKENIEILQIHTTPGKHYIEKVSEQERKRLQTILQQHLEITTSSQNDAG
jgi:LCP family protein required for cell wall assembly